MKYLFLEDPTWFCLACGAVGLVLAWRWWRHRRPVDLRRLLYPVVAAIAVAVLAAAVTTDRERIDATTRRILKAVGEGRLGPLEEHLADDFSAQVWRPLNRAEALRAARRALARHRIGPFQAASVATEVKGARARSTVVVRWRTARPRSRTTIPFRMEVIWRKLAPGWRISRARVRVGLGY